MAASKTVHLAAFAVLAVAALVSAAPAPGAKDEALQPAESIGYGYGGYGGLSGYGLSLYSGYPYGYGYGYGYPSYYGYGFGHGLHGYGSFW